MAQNVVATFEATGSPVARRRSSVFDGLMRHARVAGAAGSNERDAHRTPREGRRREQPPTDNDSTARPKPQDDAAARLSRLLRWPPVARALSTANDTLSEMFCGIGLSREEASTLAEGVCDQVKAAMLLAADPTKELLTAGRMALAIDGIEAQFVRSSGRLGVSIVRATVRERPVETADFDDSGIEVSRGSAQMGERRVDFSWRPGGPIPPFADLGATSVRFNLAVQLSAEGLAGKQESGGPVDVSI
jgi:hypothetical protein